MNELALFAGAGGGILGGKLLGWETVAAVENDPYAASVLCARQNEGLLPPFPIWDDVCTFDGVAWRGHCDVVTGGFPCTDISSAGKGAGIHGPESGLWKEFARIIGEVRPRYVFVENSPMLTVRGLGVVLGDLAALGFDAEWGVFGANASSLGAPHKRERIWIVADSNRCGGQQDSESGELWAKRSEQSPEDCGLSLTAETKEGPQRIRWWESDPAGEVADASGERGDGLWQQVGESCEAGQGGSNTETDGNPRDQGNKRNGTGKAQSELGRVATGVAARVDRLRTIGNGQVPAVAALAWRTLKARLESKH